MDDFSMENDEIYTVDDDPRLCPNCGRLMVFEEYTAYGRWFYCPHCDYEVYR